MITGIRLRFLFGLLLTLLAFGQGYASTEVSAKQARETLVHKLAERTAHRGKQQHPNAELRQHRGFHWWKAKRAAAQGPDFDDPVDRWLWYGLFGMGIAIVLGIFNLGIGGLVAFLALICLILWVVKRSGAA